MADRRNWETIAQGAISYPVDVFYYGYGIAALSGSLGPVAQERVNNTLNKFTEVIADGMGTTVNILLSPVTHGAVSGAAEQAVDDGEINITKAAFAANVAANHLLHGGALHMVSRAGSGLALRYLMTYLSAATLGRFYPGALSVHAIVNDPIVTRCLLFITKAGSIIRKGEKLQDENRLSSMGLLETAITLMTGESDAGQFIPGTGRKDGVDGIIQDMKSDTRDTLDQLQQQIRQDRDGRMDLSRHLDSLLAEAGEEAGRLMVYGLNYNNDEFLDTLIKTHNLSVRLYRAGYRTEIIEKLRTLGDPTFLIFMRVYLASLTEVLADLLQMPASADHWHRMLQLELERWDRVNDPAYVIGSE